jgi:RNA-directed DNA polymerase
MAWEALPLGKSGDVALLEHCRLLADSPQAAPCICLFDRDNDQQLKRAVGSEGWRDWGNGVAAVAIQSPRDEDKICVELLYPPEVLQRVDGDGRRVFLNSEFDRTTGHHLADEVRYTVPRPAQTLIRDDVYEVTTGRSVGLSKMTFAERVRDNLEPYEEVSFEGFRPTFELILKALRSVGQSLR